MTSLNLAKSFVGHAISVFEILNSPTLHTLQGISLARHISEMYMSLLPHLIKDTTTCQQIRQLIDKWPQWQQRLHLEFLLSTALKHNQAYEQGLLAASAALADPTATDKRVLVPCSAYVDHVLVQDNATTVTVEGWMLLWNTTPPNTIKLCLGTAPSLAPVQFEPMQRPDVLQHFVSGSHDCGFRATFELPKPLNEPQEPASIKGYYLDHVVSEPVAFVIKKNT